MGNCLFGALNEADEVIKVTTSTGGIMEFYDPVTVASITAEFPDHGIFRSQDLFWKPLSENDELMAGHSYYLLPLTATAADDGGNIVRHGHIRSNSIPTLTSASAPYRMSLDHQHYPQVLRKRSHTEAFSSKSGNYRKHCTKISTNSTKTNKSTKSGRFWKVKLVISPELLLDILSQEARTKELIESVRTVAKCGGFAGGGCISSAAVDLISDEWSLSSSSRSASSKNTALVVDI